MQCISAYSSAINNYGDRKRCCKNTRRNSNNVLTSRPFDDGRWWRNCIEPSLTYREMNYWSRHVFRMYQPDCESDSWGFVQDILYDINIIMEYGVAVISSQSNMGELVWYTLELYYSILFVTSCKTMWPEVKFIITVFALKSEICQQYYAVNVENMPYSTQQLNDWMMLAVLKMARWNRVALTRSVVKPHCLVTGWRDVWLFHWGRRSMRVVD